MLTGSRQIPKEPLRTVKADFSLTSPSSVSRGQSGQHMVVGDRSRRTFTFSVWLLSCAGSARSQEGKLLTEDTTGHVRGQAWRNGARHLPLGFTGLSQSLGPSCVLRDQEMSVWSARQRTARIL